MVHNQIYRPHYDKSWAVIIGINAYQICSPLGYACNDAKAIAQLLHDKFAFPIDNITLLTDAAATRSVILDEFYKLHKKAGSDDQVLVFFAGHGHTASGSRGEVGFLVPVDGTPENFNSLIRWGELTQTAEFIPAKHVFYIMDACYGGLALNRSAPPGSMRFAKDMMKRFSRQVLTAGKADEAVADAGGPRPGHSVFTGHLLDALDGAAAVEDGIITANRIMAYVYNKVPKDYESQQTPHYGFLDGDGDFIFNPSILNKLETKPEIERDILIEVPPTLESFPIARGSMSLQDQVKEYLSDSKYRIKLDDLVAKEIRSVQYLTQIDQFPTQTKTPIATEFAERLKRYEGIVTELQSTIALIAKWGAIEHRSTLEKAFARLGDMEETNGGVIILLGLRWYPILLLMYTGGIAALAAQDYANFATMLMTKVGTRFTGDATREIILPTVDEMIRASSDGFKMLPGYERNYVPHSEYLFKLLQPLLEDLLFLGKSYEPLYDRFEIFLALVYADLKYKDGSHVWGPLGRFGWKYSGMRGETNPFIQLTNEAAYYQNNWLPLKAGLFRGSYERFKLVSTAYEDGLKKLGSVDI